MRVLVVFVFLVRTAETQIIGIVTTGCDRAPPRLINGRYELVNVHDGISTSCVEYSCRIGFDLVGERYNFCKKGKWTSPVAPRCSPIFCSAPPLPLNGFSRRVSLVSASPVRYICRSGYAIEGSRFNYCRNGTWGNPAPRCVRRSFSDICRKIRCVRNSACNNGVCTCRPGYSGNGRRSCNRICGTPPSFPNAAHAPGGLAFHHLSYITYQCKRDYKLVDPSPTHYRCDSGTFRATTVRSMPMCNRSICVDPIPPDNGRIIPENSHRVTWNEGDVVEYLCDAGYRLVGPSTMTCMHRNSFSVSPTCIETCEADDFPNSSYSPVKANYDPIESITYRCNSGYEAVSSNDTVRTCIQGFFVGPLIECRLVCIPPLAPVNGRMFPRNQLRWFENDNVTYTCDPGFLLVGDGMQTCELPGSFANTPTCTIVCIAPIAPLNGRISPSNQTTWLQGDNVTFSCDPGFILVGAETRICQTETSFVDSPSCMAICSPPAPPLNGSIVPGNQSLWLQGDTVAYACDAGFLLVGNATVTCLNETSFAETPSCLISCDPPTLPANGMFSPSNQSVWLEGDDVSYGCNNGFLLVGNDTVTCNNKTSFSINPSCLTICDPPTPPINGSITPSNQSTWLEGDDVTYSCEPGFELVGNMTMTCNDATSFSRTPTCMEIEASAFNECPRPVAPINGGFEPANQTVWGTGDVVSYFCNGSFHLVGSTNITCLEDGSFDQATPMCLDMDELGSGGCPPPTAPNDGRYEPINQTTWGSSDVVRYFCNDNFTLIGSAKATCQSDGSYDNETPTCIDMEDLGSGGCPPPIAPTDGRFQPADQTAWGSGDIVRYFCNDNFTLVGSVTAGCQNDGSYDNLAPDCIASCPAPTAPLGGTYEPSNQPIFLVGEEVTYSCLNDTMLIGGEISICTRDHIFDPSPPHCLDITESSGDE